MHDSTDVVILKSRPAIKTGLTFYLLLAEIIRIAFSFPPSIILPTCSNPLSIERQACLWRQVRDVITRSISGFFVLLNFFHKHMEIALSNQR